jgi:hypothetical protein
VHSPRITPRNTDQAVPSRAHRQAILMKFSVSNREIRGQTFLIFPSMHRRLFLSTAFVPLLLGGCLNVKTEPIEVKPIHITVDVNVRVERALDDFFGDLDEKSTTIEPSKS